MASPFFIPKTTPAVVPRLPMVVPVRLARACPILAEVLKITPTGITPSNCGPNGHCRRRRIETYWITWNKSCAAVFVRGTCSSGMGRAWNSLRQGIASQRAQVLAHVYPRLTPTSPNRGTPADLEFGWNILGTALIVYQKDQKET